MKASGFGIIYSIISKKNILNNKSMSFSLTPLSAQQIEALSALTRDLNREQTLWLAGFFQGLAAREGNPATQ